DGLGAGDSGLGRKTAAAVLVGTVAEVMGVSRLPDGRRGASVRGVERVAVVGTVRRGARVTALVRAYTDSPHRRTAKLLAAAQTLKTLAMRLTPQHDARGDELRLRLLEADDPARIVAMAQALVPASVGEKTGWLAERDVHKRVQAV